MIMYQRSSASKMVKRVRGSQDHNATSHQIPLTLLDILKEEKPYELQPPKGMLKSDLQIELNRVMKEAMSSGQRLRVATNTALKTQKINTGSSNLLVKNHASMTN